jgi:hypothetical protein
MIDRENGHPFHPEEWYSLGELRLVATQIQETRRDDPVFSAILRAEEERWAKDWLEELWPLKVLADHKGFPDEDQFYWTPQAAADFELRTHERGLLKIQSTMAYPEWPVSVAKQGGHLHKLEMRQANKEGFAFLGGRVSQPTARGICTDARAWRTGIARALKNKLRREYTDLHLAVFAMGCAVHMVEMPFDQVVASAIEEVGTPDCKRIFEQIYVFDAQPGLFFELGR